MTIYKVAYCVGLTIPPGVMEVLIALEPSMEDPNEGTGQYEISQILEELEEGSDGWRWVKEIENKGVDYIEA